MENYILPTLSDIFVQEKSNNDLSAIEIELARENLSPSIIQRNQDLYLKAQKEWYSAIATINQLLENSVKISDSQDLKNQEITKTHKDKKIKKTTLVLENLESQTQSKFPTSNSLLSNLKSYRGLVLSSPTPVLTNPALTNSFYTSVFTSEIPESLDWLSMLRWQTLPLLPAADSINSLPTAIPILPLSTKDPITNEQFCLVLTAEFSLIMVLGKNQKNEPAFLFSFDPEIVKKAWIVLQKRIVLPEYFHSEKFDKYQNFIHQYSQQLARLDNIFEQFSPLAPDYKIVMEFSRLLLSNLPIANTKNETLEINIYSKNREKKETTKSRKSTIDIENFKSPDVELLQAIAHEVKTPLATIQTLTRLLLKRPNLNQEVMRKRLQMIDAECTSQIERFNLIFRAAELETQQPFKQQHPYLQLTTIPLAQVFQNSIPRWQQKATQRNHTLKVILPPKMPTVISDPTILDQVLGNLIENFSRNLPPSSLIQVEVMLAGNQLKLQLKSDSNLGEKSRSPFTSSTKTPLKSIGPLLMFQPETGSLSLNLKVTKNLFQAIGAKLVIRQRPTKGEIMTIFFPVQ
ncbi:MAG: HAMP domain-containing histidine kinase [Okeania sp. SIO3I5]|uniref:sensor histidine kinase n=1 Tax=Okeania sp. SIO3I5 TaxID=2607805 RepID=UPI0013B6BF13|nr:HAMP domain-containing sensor histidine kinase [Okeania sp. SIO3I5]NEQ39304.1 HAMP domain-containing histidine kinase [Okeania sp. SIO3I5]